MIIDVDIGNSRLKWRELGQEVIHACSDWDYALNDWARLTGVHRIRISSVASSEKTEKFISQIHKNIHVTAECAYVKNGISGLTLAYENVETLGVDRWLAMLALNARKTHKPWLVFSAGTALTADLIDRHGAHMGGYIVPGLELCVTALNLHTAKIGYTQPVPEKNWHPGTTTLECVQSGLSAMYQGYINAIITKTIETMPNVQTVYTGGGSQALSMLMIGAEGAFVDGGLVLDGLSVALP